MRRRDVSKVLLVPLAAYEPVAKPATSVTPTAADLQSALRARGAVRIAVGTYHLTSKLRTVVQNDITGDSRHDTVLLPGAFADYVLEVGNGQPGPNGGRIARLKIYGNAGNLGCLHMNTLSHMWHLDDLIFSGGPCPALVVDNCWDSNYTNIDILGHVSPGTDPAQTSAVIFRNGCNNIYCRGLRIEGASSGGLYVDSGPIYVVTGKIDDGFGAHQSAAAVTVSATGSLIVDDFYLGGMLNRFHIDVAGALRLGRVALDGGTNSPAAINDRRAWSHINRVTQPSYSAAIGGPFIPSIDLGEAQFHRFHPSVATLTGAAVYSRIHPLRQARNLTVQSDGRLRGNALHVTTSLRNSHEDLYKNSFLVHNATGSHRKILTSAAAGELVLEGVDAVDPGGDYSIEYCANHDTPIRYEYAVLDRGLNLFAVVSGSVTVASEAAYITDIQDAAYGTTRIKVAGHGIAPGRDLTGLFLVDNVSGDANYIEYGVDDAGFIGLIYDRRTTLDISRTFSVVAGHATAPVRDRATLTRLLAITAAVAPNLSQGTDFEITVPSGAPLTIESPTNAPVSAGQRISLTLVNGTSAGLGVLTWAPIYRLSAWVSPAPGHGRSIDFRYNGKNWVEVARTPADVPA